MSVSSKAVVLNASFKASSTQWLKQWITSSQVAFSCTNLPTPLCFPKLTLAPSTLISTNLLVKDLFPILSKASLILYTILDASAILTGSVLKYLRVGVPSFKNKTRTTSSVTLEYVLPSFKQEAKSSANFDLILLLMYSVNSAHFRSVR